jgi:hypothetical protein
MALDMSVMFGGHFSESASHWGPYLESGASTTLPPRLPKSAGFSAVDTWCHVKLERWRILFTRLATNCLYSPVPRIQNNETVLSSQQWRSAVMMGWIACWTLVIKLAAMWPATSSKLGIVSPRLAKRDLAVTIYILCYSIVLLHHGISHNAFPTCITKSV